MTVTGSMAQYCSTRSTGPFDAARSSRSSAAMVSVRSRSFCTALTVKTRVTSLR